MKKVLSILLVLNILVSIFVLSEVTVYAKSESTHGDGTTIQPYGETRDVVLVLDSSSSMSSMAMSNMKNAAIKFCEDVLDANGNNNVAIVAYGTDITMAQNFTNDINVLKECINSLSAKDSTNISIALQKADEFLSSSTSNGKIKNIVLLTDGMPEKGIYEMDGKYNRLGPDFSYPYGNALYTYFKDYLNDKYNIYTLGFFHSLSNTYKPYATTLLKDIQNKGYYEVTNADDLVFTFGDIADDIVNSDEVNCPIVVVPGVMGSRLYFGNDKVWDPFEIDVVDPFFRLDTKMDMKRGLSVHNYNYDESGRTTPINQALLKKGNREYGAKNIYENLMDSIIDAFSNESGACTRSVYFFSYDFRQSNASNAASLSEYINDILMDNPGYSKVDIVAHSMGGLVTSSYIDAWGNYKVRKVITAGTPYEGSPKLVDSVLTKNVLGRSVKDALLWSVGGLSKSLKASFTSLSELAPTESYFNNNSTKFKQYVGLEWTSPFTYIERYKNLTLEEYNEINSIIFGLKAASAIAFHKDIKGSSGSNILASLDNSYFLIGINQKTISGIIYNDGTSLSSMDVKDLYYENIGDGTVPYDSASMMKTLENLPEGRVKKVSDSHTGIVSNTEGIEWIVDVLSDNVNVSTDEMIRQGYIVIRIACPVDVEVTLNGEMLCSEASNFNDKTSFGVLDLIGENSEIKMLCLDPSNDYKIVIKGNGQGKMDYAIRYFNEENDMLQEYSFINVEITETTVITTGTEQNNIVLNVDQEDDGIVDYILTPGDCTDNGYMKKINDDSYIFISNNMDITYDIVSRFDDKKCVNISITNKSQSTIHGWMLAYDTVEQIESIWNGIAGKKDGFTVIKNGGYNQDIKPGETVYYGYIATINDTKDIPDRFRWVNEFVPSNIDSYEVSFFVDSDWKTGYNASIIITNNGESVIEDWVLLFDFEEEISNIWNGNIVSHENGQYMVHNTQNNSFIKPGESVIINMTIQNRTTQDEPHRFVLKEVVESKESN